MRISSYLRSKRRTTVVVHLESGTSIRGVLAAEHRDGIVLVHAEQLMQSGNIPIDGEARIARDKVDWIQCLDEAVS